MPEREFKITFLGDASRAVGAIGALEARLNGLTSKIPATALVAGGLAGVVGGAVVGGMVSATKAAAQYGDAILEASQRSQLSITTLQELQHAANLTGTSIEGIETGTKKMSKFLADVQQGSKPAIKVINDLNINLDDLAKQNFDEKFITLANAIASIEDPVLQSDAALTIFGKSGTALLPMLADGAEGLAKYREEAHALGLVMSEEDVQAAADLQDKFDKLEAKMAALGRVAGTILVPIASTLADVLLDDVVPAVERVAGALGAAFTQAERFGGALAGIIGMSDGDTSSAKSIAGDSLKAGILSAWPGISQLRALASVAEMFDGTRAEGGPVTAGKMYWVGEHGPEPFIPDTNGTILPSGTFDDMRVDVGGVDDRRSSHSASIGEKLARIDDYVRAFVVDRWWNARGRDDFGRASDRTGLPSRDDAMGYEHYEDSFQDYQYSQNDPMGGDSAAIGPQINITIQGDVLDGTDFANKVRKALTDNGQRGY